MQAIQTRVEDGIYSVRASATLLDEGICICLAGGKSHIGTVLLCLPRESLRNDGSVSCTTSVINVLGHKDDIVALPLAEALCKEFNMPVTVTAGIHLDAALATDIGRLCQNVNTLTGLLREALRAN